MSRQSAAAPAPAADRGHRRRRPVRHPRLRRQPQPSRVRRRPRRRVRRPHGGHALHGRRYRQHRGRDAGVPTPTHSQPGRGACVAEARALGHDDDRDQVRLRADRRCTSAERSAIAQPAHRRDHASRRPRGAARVRRPRRRLRRAGVHRDGPGVCPRRPLDRRLLRGRRVRRRPVPGGARGRARRRSRPAPARQPARAGPWCAARRRAGLRLGRSLHVPLRRRHRRPRRRRDSGDVPAGHRLLAPASPIPTPAALSMPGSRSRSRATATRDRATRRRCRSVSPSRSARWA